MRSRLEACDTKQANRAPTATGYGFVGFEGTMEGEDEEKQREKREGKGKEGKGKEGEKGREEEEEKAREEGDNKQMVDMPGNVNDVVVMSQSPNHSHTTTTNKQLAPAPTTSPKPVPTRQYNTLLPPESLESPVTSTLWCNPMTMTLEQIKEKTRHLLCEWLKDNGIPFPREILKMLRNLKTRVRSKDEEKTQRTGSLTMANPPAKIPA